MIEAIGPCTLCAAPAAVRVRLSHGCAASDARDQVLCPQHVATLEPVGTMEVVEDRTAGEPH